MTSPKGRLDLSTRTADSGLVSKQLDLWQKKLIDFSKRNQLLYFRPRTSLSIELKESAEEIFRKLVLESKSLQFVAMAKATPEEALLPLDEEDLAPGELYAEAPDELGDLLDYDPETSLLADKDQRTLDQSLSKLRARSKASLQEQGVNILYLALYFIEWQESTSEDKARSPLFLLPVSIERRGLSGVYKLNLIDDEIRINPTLSYKLIRDFALDLSKLHSLNPEAQGASVVDNLDSIDSIESLQALVSEIQSMIGTGRTQSWRIIDESSLSLFSFAKLALYKDLEDHRKQILLHPVVRQIAGDKVPAEEFGSALAQLIDAKQIDKQIDANTACQILDADSSQQEAIYAAKAGQSFVLQGPPGTGKSQTIANIIAESLAQRKKILFVSEKKAALDVVMNRLKTSALDNFCLELHGSQQKKSDIVEDLRRTVETIKTLALEPKRSVYIEDINAVKEELQASIDELHAVRPALNLSLYELYGELSRLRQIVKDDVSFTISNIERLGQAELADLDYLFKQLAKKSEILCDYSNFVWRNANVSKLSFELENDIKSNFLEFQRVLRRLKEYADPISLNYFSKEVHNLKEFKWLAEACRLALQSPFPSKDWLNKSKIQEIASVAIQAKSEHEDRNSRKETLLSKYSQGYLDLDHNTLLARFSNRYSGVMRFLDLSYWKDVSRIKKLSLYNETRDLKTLVSDLEQAVLLDKQTEEINDEATKLSFALGDFYQHFDTNWQETLTAIRWVQKVLDKFDSSELPSQLAETISNPEDFQDFRQQAEELIAAYEVVKTQLKFYREIFPNPNIELNKLSFPELIEHLEELISNTHKIEDWLEFKDLVSRAEVLGIKSLIDNLCANPSESNADLLQERFLAKFYELWADKIEIENPRLRKFSGQEQRLLVQKFIDLDLKQINKTITGLSKSLALDWIEYASNPLNQEALQSLQIELNKKKRHKPMRLLLKEIPELLQTLKPCWMMSPLAVSQLIDSTSADDSRVHFDLIIFDEASQIRTEDAISSIYRGRQLILAGDTHQLPPTNFFSYIEEDPDSEDNHFESVLDECSVFLTNRTLNWHYRSRHEALISFSNYHIYDNRLISFPSPRLKSEDLGLHFEFIEAGRYEKGSRFNKLEAKAVAQAVLEHYRTQPERSLGVIAFSEAQQDAIERELASLLRKEPQLETFFNEDSPDAFFIKNLESVQGDERDIIYFSIAYARDRKGSLSHNFGPLNREGGHRRLNVAITRARLKLKVFSSIRASDIDLERTNSQGARLLKQYLAYAENPDLVQGDTALEFAQVRTNAVASSIAEQLHSKGYHVTQLLGNSDYRIDLAVARAEDPSRYVLAIETDGPMYQSATTVRDRERLRGQVLESLGWKLHRVYARDWARNPQLELERIIADLA